LSPFSSAFTRGAAGSDHPSAAFEGGVGACCGAVCAWVAVPNAIAVAMAQVMGTRAYVCLLARLKERLHE
jgi:hypothetical protein